MSATDALAQALTEAGEPARVGIYSEAESILAALPEGWQLVGPEMAAVVAAARAVQNFYANEPAWYDGGTTSDGTKLACIRLSDAHRLDDLSNALRDALANLDEVEKVKP